MNSRRMVLIMRKKFPVILLVLACLALGGCGDTGDSNAVNESVDSDENSKHEDTEAGAEADFTDDMEKLNDEANTNDYMKDDESAEIEGIIAMLLMKNNSSPQRDVQVISINPDTGEQNIIADFMIRQSGDYPMTLPSSNHIPSHSLSWFSDDLTKMAVTKGFGGTAEVHAGWIDTDGNFFDVTEAIDAAEDKSFADPAPVMQNAVGFSDNNFIIYENLKYYAIPMDNISTDAVTQIDWEGTQYFYDTGDEFYTTDQFNDGIHLLVEADVATRYHNSLIWDKNDNSGTSYIPASARSNWSGVLNPMEDSIAFLSLPAYVGSTLELYTIPTNGSDPIKVPLQPNEACLFDVASLNDDDLSDLIYSSGEAMVTWQGRFCFLIDWR